MKANYKKPINEFLDRSEHAIAHGALTNSKRPSCFVKGVYPTHLVKGQGCYVWDTDGKKYIDCIAGLGSNLLGYAHEEITDAIVQRSRLGSTLSLGTDLEVEVAEKVKEIFPTMEKVRFLKTGSEACSAALRIARVYLDEWDTASFGYHGWHDDFVSLTPPANGVPTRDWMFNKRYFENGSYICEPVTIDWSEKTRLELEKLVSNKYNVVIFDEIITGCRVPSFCTTNAWNLKPDLMCLGKAIAGGMPLSIVGGKSEIMDSDYFVSSTFAGETLSLAACLKNLQLLQTKYSIDLLWSKGMVFLEEFNAIWPEGVQLEGYPTRSILKGSDLNKALFMQESCKAGILAGSSFFFIFPHMEIMDEMLSTFSDILRKIKKGDVRLEGEMPQTPYAQKVRNQ